MIGKLGKLPPREDERTLRLASYVDAAKLPKPPSGFGVVPSKSIDWPMFANDEFGDCTCATAGHMLQAWRKADGSKPLRINDATILLAYHEITGFDPTDPSTDNGAVEIDVLNHWRRHGIAGRKIEGYAKVNPQHRRETQVGCWLFGGLYIGIALPITAQRQRVWDVADGPQSEPGSWGGHAVNVLGYDYRGVTVVTWGAPKRMTWAFWERYVDEAYALLSPDWTGPDGISPRGFNVDRLREDLAAF